MKKSRFYYQKYDLVKIKKNKTRDFIFAILQKNAVKQYIH